jgi:hypothetical protein
MVAAPQNASSGPNRRWRLRGSKIRMPSARAVRDCRGSELRERSRNLKIAPRPPGGNQCRDRQGGEMKQPSADEADGGVGRIGRGPASSTSIKEGIGFYADGLTGSADLGNMLRFPVA